MVEQLDLQGGDEGDRDSASDGGTDAGRTNRDEHQHLAIVHRIGTST